MASSYFYIRVHMDQIPAEKRGALALRDEKNYPVLHIDTEKGRLLVPDDQSRLLWVPMGICRFVRMT